MSETPLTISPDNERDRHLAMDLWETFNGSGGWWTCRFLKLCASSDLNHLTQLRLAYPREVDMYIDWHSMPQPEFAQRWSIPIRSTETPP